VAYARSTRQVREFLLPENLADVAHTAMRVQSLSVARNHPGGFLPSMLQRVQPEIGQPGGIFMIEDTKYATFIFELIQHIVVGLQSEF
jgi:hypothetical protein